MFLTSVKHAGLLLQNFRNLPLSDLLGMKFALVGLIFLELVVLSIYSVVLF